MSRLCSKGKLPQAPFRLIPGEIRRRVLAIGSGLALGREGPSVQMGASIAHLVGTLFRRNWPDCRVLLAAGAGAGLATAFNAPIAGAIFVLEELVRRSRRGSRSSRSAPRRPPSAWRRRCCSATHLTSTWRRSSRRLETRPLFFVLGALAGRLAVIYNRVLLETTSAHRPVRSLAGRECGRA